MRKDDRLLRLGILGCGPIAQIAHFDAARKARNIELTALCDIADDLRASMAARHQPRFTYRDYGEMLANPEIEAVLIGVADQFHVSLASQAIAAGKHVFVEKPLGVTVEECEALRDQLSQERRLSSRRATGRLESRPSGSWAGETNKDEPPLPGPVLLPMDEKGESRNLTQAAAQSDRIVLQIGNNRRFDPGVAFAQKFVQDEIGGLLSVKAWYWDSVYRYSMTDNLQPIVEQSALARRPDGNPKLDKRRYFILTHASHLVDTTRFLAGEIVQVRARLLERFGALCWLVDVEFANGALGHLDLTIPVRGDFEEGFQIQGEHGSVKGQVFLPWFHKASVVEVFSTKDRQYRRPIGEDAYTYKLQLESFADCILRGEPQRGAGIDDGVAAVRAMVAIARSAVTGDWVRLADVTGGV